MKVTDAPTTADALCPATEDELRFSRSMRYRVVNAITNMQNNAPDYTDFIFRIDCGHR